MSSEPPAKQFYDFGSFRLDLTARVLLRDGGLVPMTPKAIETLMVLIEHQGEVVPKEDLLRAVWPDTFVEEGNLAHNISVLRKVFGGKFIETVPKRGYRFIGDPPSAGAVPTPGPEPRGRRLWPLVVIALVPAIAVSWLLVQKYRRTEPAGIRSVAVLPFVNLSSDPENEYFSDGLTEELLNGLMKIEGLHVAARTSSFQFKGKAADIRAIGRALNVAAVVEGSVRKEANRVRVTAQLNEVENGYHLWSETYDRELQDIFSIQEDICHDIVSALRIQLAAGRERPLVKRYTADIDVYTLYLKGRYEAGRRTLAGVYKSLEYFQQAIGRDPRYTPALAGIADSYVILGNYDILPPSDAFPRARQAALRAIELDPELAEPHASLGALKSSYEWDWAGAESEYKRALEIKPEYAAAHQGHAEHLSAMGRREAAMAEIRRARELDPLSPSISYVMAFLLFFHRQYDEALEQCRKTQDIDPKFFLAHFIRGYALVEKKMYEDAIASFRLAIDQAGGRGLRYLGHAYAVSGRRKEALAVIEQLQDQKKKMYISPFDFALIYAGLGDKDRAIEWLAKGYAERTPWLSYLKLDPRFDPLRSDARFKALLAKMKFD